MEEQVRVVSLATGKEDDLSTSKSFSSVGNVSSNTSSDVSGVSSRFSKNDTRSVVSSNGSFASAKSAPVKKSSTSKKAEVDSKSLSFKSEEQPRQIFVSLKLVISVLRH